MFAMRWMLERMFESQRVLGAAQAEINLLRSENGRLKATCDWLADQVTQLNAERAALLAHTLNVQVPAAIIQAPAAVTGPSLARNRRADDLTPEKLQAMAARFAPSPVGARGEVFRPPSTPENTGEAEAQAAMAIFEDMGDDAAARAGIQG
jgi:hypothetical protein